MKEMTPEGKADIENQYGDKIIEEAKKIGILSGVPLNTFYQGYVCAISQSPTPEAVAVAFKMWCDEQVVNH